MRRPVKSQIYFSPVNSSYVNQVHQKFPHLTQDNARNVGYLCSFFNSFLKTIRRLCTFPNDKKLKVIGYNGNLMPHTLNEILGFFMGVSEQCLADLHNQYSPAPTNIGIKDKDAVKLAKQIEKHYRELRVYIRVTPSQVRADRYIFTIDTLDKTKDDDVKKHRETVQRRLKKYEYFRVDLTNPRSIKLIVAEKALTDNNLIEILEHDDFADSKLKIPYAMGFDDAGTMCIEDIEEFPHMLFGGSSKSGKSTAIMCLLMSIAYKHRTGNVNVLLLDLLEKPESDYLMFNDQPFMAAPVITEPTLARKAILSLHKEKIRRLKDSNLQNLPYIVCVIDEFPRLYFGATKDLIEQVQAAMDDLLSSGRHSHIHLVLAAQDPSKKAMVGSIANISARVALRCSHYRYSNNILGRGGAEKLIGRGQMIFDSILESDKRILGSFMSSKDMQTLLSEIKTSFEQQNKYPFKFNPEDSALTFTELSENTFASLQKSHRQSDDDILWKAIIWVLQQEKVANSRLQTEYKIGNTKANRLLDRMTGMGLIRKLHGNLGWETIPRCFEDIPSEVIDYLKKHNVAELQIRNIFI